MEETQEESFLIPGEALLDQGGPQITSNSQEIHKQTQSISVSLVQNGRVQIKIHRKPS